ncbi:hypothetical protein OYC64_014229 [Pagothenia borchgrevinki]|uniref:Uncharacterized protein n=1 Tax=Pagothenia borchgrevinki TaxID=8213 RepID=A0ABD2GZZ7_PAGBO
MSACCVTGCKNRDSSSSKLKFYRIPTGTRPFQANRRKLWLQRIREVNGEEIRANAKVCGAHFISKEASLEHDSPDFVPSVFPSTKQSPKRKVKRDYGSRKRWPRAAKMKTEEETTSPRADSPEELQTSDLFEEIQKSPTPSLQEAGESLTEETETETTLSPNKTASPFKAPTGVLQPNMSPVVFLKHVFLPAGGFKCEQCNQNFTNVSQLMKHKKLHEEHVEEQEEHVEEQEEHEEEIEENASFVCESCGKIFSGRALFSGHECELSFPCNMCDRAFATSQNLKRHKLQHVRDDRKCRECGTMFCKRHKQTVVVSVAESAPVWEEEPSVAEPKNVYLMSERVQEGAIPSASHTVSLPKIHPMLIPVPLSLEPPLIGRLKPRMCDVLQLSIKPLPPPPPPLRPSLQLFSPRFLTSALLQVDRNYDYMLSKPMPVKKNIVKEEPQELPLVLPAEISVENIKKEQTAYDMEFAI